MWAGYGGGGGTTIRHLHPIPSMHQLPQQQVELLSNPLQMPSTIALQHLGQQHQMQHPHIQQLIGGPVPGTRNICIGGINTANIINSGQTSTLMPSSIEPTRCHSSEDEVSVQTPLMVKRESTV